MNKGTKRLLAGLAFLAGAVSTGTLIRKKIGMTAKPQRASENPLSVWARPGMTVVFRAELMPGRDRGERTAHVKALLPSNRVTLHEVEGEHAQNEFEK